MSEGNGERVRLPIWQLLTLIVTISVSAAGVGAYNQKEFWELDRRWQTRWAKTVETINAAVSKTGNNLESKIDSMPHQWFRDIVESNTRRIERQNEDIRRLENRLVVLENQE